MRQEATEETQAQMWQSLTYSLKGSIREAMGYTIFSENETSAFKEGISSIDSSKLIHPKSFSCCKDFMRQRQH